MIENLHQSILTAPILDAFQPTQGKVFLDATFGDGGHTLELLQNGATVIAFDQDSDAINRGTKRILEALPQLTINSQFDPALSQQLTLIHSSFTEIDQAFATQSLPSLDGALYDLGVSTHQLLAKDRGFSFNQEAPLDMRMDRRLGVTAADLVNALGVKELTNLFKDLSQEPFAGRIARAIVKHRATTPITTTTQLAAIVATVKRHTKIHPATLVFQALRMAVNLEREAIRESLPQAVSHLKPHAPLAVITFHSTEDRLVKQTLLQLGLDGLLTQTSNKPLRPSLEEINNNPRARSAKLRLCYKQNE